MAKTISFAAVHFSVAFAVGYLMTGSFVVGGAIALVEPLCNTVAYFFHEKVWERIRVRKSTNDAPRSVSREMANGEALGQETGNNSLALSP
ncbi:DUF2061 domain-containing protein [Hahella ganghwensis]|uniref:DUF2061 domain-containing protein n=1 Tax=Hahella ganghwensis TaxID=286420 RepID=UPI0003A201B5|nr:DUF2061 domain-containing protein [Hahella ganghwensis]